MTERGIYHSLFSFYLISGNALRTAGAVSSEVECGWRSWVADVRWTPGLFQGILGGTETDTHHWTRNRARTCAGDFSDGSAAHLHSPALQRTIKMADDYGVNDHRDALTSTHTSTRYFLFIFISTHWAGFHRRAYPRRGGLLPRIYEVEPTDMTTAWTKKTPGHKTTAFFSFVLFGAHQTKKPRKGAILYARALCTLSWITR